LLSLSGNVFSSKELNQLQRQGAVGDILLRFFDAEGKPIKTSLDDRVIGMQLEQLSGLKRSVGIAGGEQKLEAIRGALLGRLNVLITNRHAAERLSSLHDRTACSRSFGTPVGFSRMTSKNQNVSQKFQSKASLSKKDLHAARVQ